MDIANCCMQGVMRQWLYNDNNNMKVSFLPIDLRARYIIWSNTILPADLIIGDEEYVLKILPRSRPGLFLVEIFLRKENWPKLDEEILEYCNDKLYSFLDILSAISYTPSRILKFVSISPIAVKRGQTFEMLVSEMQHYRKPIKVNIEALENYHEWNVSSNRDILAQLRMALSSESIDMKFLGYFAILDQIAVREVDQVELFCDNCGEKINDVKPTNNFLRALFAKHGVEKKKYEKIRKLRHKLAHGAGSRTSHFFRELRQSIGHLETVCFTEVTERCGIRPANAINIVYGPPIWVIEGKKIFPRLRFVPPIFVIENYSHTMNVSFTALKNAKHHDNGKESEGVFGPPGPSRKHPILRDAWPN